MAKIQVDQYTEIPVFLENGWFTITIKENTLKHRTLNGLMKEVSKLEQPKDAMCLEHFGMRPPVRVKVVYDRKAQRYRNVENGKLLGYGQVYAFNPVVFSAMVAISAKEYEFIQQWNEQIRKLVRL